VKKNIQGLKARLISGADDGPDLSLAIVRTGSRKAKRDTVWSPAFHVVNLSAFGARYGLEGLAHSKLRRLPVGPFAGWAACATCRAREAKNLAIWTAFSPLLLTPVWIFPQKMYKLKLARRISSASIHRWFERLASSLIPESLLCGSQNHDP